MSDPIGLSMAQQFEIAKMERVIDGTSNVDDLRKLAKMLHQAWQVQRSAALWAMRHSLPKATDFTSIEGE
jgi:hypothetical protein